MVRLAHFSDIHIGLPTNDWKVGDWFTKRLTSWANHRLFGRGHRFASAEAVTTQLMDELMGREVDHLVFSGDATSLGFTTEVARAAELLRVTTCPIPGLAIPGNHDYCTPSAARSGDFERFFARWQEGRRIGHHVYPFAQQAGDVWLIGVNAATGNRLPWDAGGSVGHDQLVRLRELLAGLEPGVKVLVLHYPVSLSDGRREPSYHGLRDLDAVLEVAAAGNVHLWLHGHRHTPYFLPKALGASFPSICAGTATQLGIWSYGEYTIEGTTLHAVRRTYDVATGRFRDVETFTLQLGSRSA